MSFKWVCMQKDFMLIHINWNVFSSFFQIVDYIFCHRMKAVDSCTFISSLIPFHISYTRKVLFLSLLFFCFRTIFGIIFKLHQNKFTKSASKRSLTQHPLGTTIPWINVDALWRIQTVFICQNVCICDYWIWRNFYRFKSN